MLIRNLKWIWDKRQDYILRKDRRSRGFGVIRNLIKKKRVSRTWDCNVWLDQGREGACVGFGIAHLLSATPIPLKVTEDYAKKNIYWEAQKIDPWPGGSYPGAEPKYEGSSVLAGLKVVQKLGWIKEYEWAFNIDDLILGIGHRSPAVIGVRWYRSMSKPGRNGFIKVSGWPTGGHCILVNGVNVEKEYFILHNSWGRNWGQDGECKLSFRDMEKLISLGGEFAFVNGKAQRRLKENESNS